MIERVVRFDGPRRVSIAEEPSRPLGPLEVRLRTLHSGISAGTELTQYRGQNPYLERQWDGESRLFVAGEPSIAYPLFGIGYEEVGEVIELGEGVTRLAAGQVVWGSWGHRTHAILQEEEAAPRVLGPEVPARFGVFARIAAIALNPVFDADIHLGETVAVFGLGTVGLLAAQLARLNGAEVIAVDGLERRLALARSLGFAVLDHREGRVAERIKAMTGNRGADASLEVTGSYRALHEAIRATAYNSRVVVAGFMPGEALGLRLGEEFHHNRIELVCSQTSGVSPRLDHRWDRLRLEQTAMRLAGAGRLELDALVSHRFALRDAAEAYRLLDEQPGEALQVVFDFPPDGPEGA